MILANLHTLMERSEGLSYRHIKGGYFVLFFFFGGGGGANFGAWLLLSGWEILWFQALDFYHYTGLL